MVRQGEPLSLRQITPLVLIVFGLALGVLYLTYWVARLAMTGAAYLLCLAIRVVGRRDRARVIRLVPLEGVRRWVMLAHALCYTSAVTCALILALTFVADGSMTRAVDSSAHFASRIAPVDVALRAYWKLDIALLTPVWLGTVLYARALWLGWSGIVGSIDDFARVSTLSTSVGPVARGSQQVR